MNEFKDNKIDNSLDKDLDNIVKEYRILRSSWKKYLTDLDDNKNNVSSNIELGQNIHNIGVFINKIARRRKREEWKVDSEKKKTKKKWYHFW